MWTSKSSTCPQSYDRNSTSRRSPWAIPRQDRVYAQTHTPFSLCIFLFRGMNIFLGLLSCARSPSLFFPTTNLPSYRQTQTHINLIPTHLTPETPPSTYLTLANSLPPKAPAQPHLTVPKWAASVLVLPGPSGAPDSMCVCVSSGPALCGHSKPFKMCQGSRCWERLELTHVFVFRSVHTSRHTKYFLNSCIIASYFTSLMLHVLT